MACVFDCEDFASLAIELWLEDKTLEDINSVKVSRDV